MNYGKAIRECREAAGFSMEEWIGLLGGDAEYITSIENEREVNNATLNTIAEVLDIPIQRLMIIGLEESDSRKKDLFNKLYPSVKNLAISMIKKKFDDEPEGFSAADCKETFETIKTTSKEIASEECTCYDDKVLFQSKVNEAKKEGGPFKQVRDFHDTLVYENELYYLVNECGVRSLYMKDITPLEKKKREEAEQLIPHWPYKIIHGDTEEPKRKVALEAPNPHGDDDHAIPESLIPMH